MSRQPPAERVRDSVRLRGLDVRDRLSGRTDRLVPPRRLDLCGHSDLVETGDVGLGGLQPSHAVLDVGCGTGRMARPLAGPLSSEEADHHLAELARVRRPGGRALVTFFPLDPESRRRIAAGESGLAFLDAGRHVAVVSEDVPEEAVAYDTGWVGERLGRHGFTVEAVRPGAWSGREDAVSFQDLVVAVR